MLRSILSFTRISSDLKFFVQFSFIWQQFQLSCISLLSPPALVSMTFLCYHLSPWLCQWILEILLMLSHLSLSCTFAVMYPKWLVKTVLLLVPYLIALIITELVLKLLSSEGIKALIPCTHLPFSWNGILASVLLFEGFELANLSLQHPCILHCL